MENFKVRELVKEYGLKIDQLMEGENKMFFYPSTYHSDFHKIINDEIFTDVTFQLEHQQEPTDTPVASTMKAHKVRKIPKNSKKSSNIFFDFYNFF